MANDSQHLKNINKIRTYSQLIHRIHTMVVVTYIFFVTYEFEGPCTFDFFADQAGYEIDFSKW